MSEELEISRLTYEEREAAFEQLMRSAAKALPLVRGSRNAARPRPSTGSCRGVVALARAKAKGYAAPRQPDRINKFRRVTHPR
jgi:hypothetical protein